MSSKKAPEVSGWYSKSRLSEAERAEQLRQVEEWYRKKTELNYRPIAVDVPGKMLLALGQTAQERDIPLSEMIEGILAEYLEREGIAWDR